MTAPGIEVRGLSLHVGDRRLFDNLSFTVPGGQWCRCSAPAAPAKPACCG